MKLYIAADHAGFQLKENLKPFLFSLGHEVVDCGAAVFDENDDYPGFILKAAKAVAKDSGSRGIVIGGSGQGEAIAANRVKKIRAVVYYGEPAVKQSDADGKTLDIIAGSREHNDANVLSLGARFLSDENAKDAVQRWLSTPFSGKERHARRIKKIDD